MAVNYDGFAQGFQGGFGLMQNAINDQRRIEEAQADREANIAFRAEQNRLSGLRIQNEKNYQDKMLGIKETEAQTASTKAENEATRLANEGVRLANDGVRLANEGERIKNQGTIADMQSDNAALERKKITQRMREEEAAVATQNLMNQLDRYERGEVEWSSLEPLIKATEGTLFDFRELLDPELSVIDERIRSQLASGDIDDQIVLKAMNKMLLSSNQIGIGETVGDMHNAPDWMKDGNYKIVGKEFANIYPSTQVVLDESGQEVEKTGVSGDIRVKVEGPNGETFYYLAQATEGRAAVGGKPVVLDVDELMSSYTAYMNLASFANEQKIKIESVVQEGRYDSADAYQNAYNKVAEKYNALDPESASPIQGMSMREFKNSGRLYNDYIRHETLFGKRESTRDEYQAYINELRSSEPIRGIKKLDGSALTENEIIRLAGGLTRDSRGRIVKDKNFNEIRNTLEGVRGSRTYGGGKKPTDDDFDPFAEVD